LFADIARGDWGRIARLMAAGLFAGVLWESFNAASRAKWIYTVPLLEHVKLFEMPPIGFLGFPFFALEVWSLYPLLAPRHSSRRPTPTRCGAVCTAARGLRPPRCASGSGRRSGGPSSAFRASHHPRVYICPAHTDPQTMTSPPTCTRCGQPVGPADRFCPRCG